MKFGYNFGNNCNKEKGMIINSWLTGDMECDAVSPNTSVACISQKLHG